MNKPTIELKNWYIDNYTYQFLFGNAYGHGKFENGTFVRTSKIQKATKTENGIVVETHNSIYNCNFDNVHEDYFNNLDMLEMLELFGEKEIGRVANND